MEKNRLYFHILKKINEDISINKDGCINKMKIHYSMLILETVLIQI